MDDGHKTENGQSKKKQKGEGRRTTERKKDRKKERKKERKKNGIQENKLVNVEVDL